MPGAGRTRSLACKIKKHTSIVTTGQPKRSGIPRAMFDGLLRTLPGVPGLLAPVALLIIINQQDLTPASGRQDHTA
jgi:hypothetical protein